MTCQFISTISYLFGVKLTEHEYKKEFTAFWIHQIFKINFLLIKKKKNLAFSRP